MKVWWWKQRRTCSVYILIFTYLANIEMLCLLFNYRINKKVIAITNRAWCIIPWHISFLFLFSPSPHTSLSQNRKIPRDETFITDSCALRRWHSYPILCTLYLMITVIHISTARLNKKESLCSFVCMLTHFLSFVYLLNAVASFSIPFPCSITTTTWLLSKRWFYISDYSRATGTATPKFHFQNSNYSFTNLFTS